MTVLTAAARKRLKPGEFAGPNRSYPVEDKAHAANAKARAKQQLDAGNLSRTEYERIVARANRVLAAAIMLCMGLGIASPARADSAEALASMVSAAAEANHVFCNAAGSASIRKAPCALRSLYVTTGASAGYLLTYNAVVAPGDGAVLPRECIAVPANSTTAIDFITTKEPYVTGLTAVFSTTGCFTQTSSATAFFKGQVE